MATIDQEGSTCLSVCPHLPSPLDTGEGGDQQLDPLDPVSEWRR